MNHFSGKTVICLAVCAAVLALSGCGSSKYAFEPEGNSLYIADDGTVSTAFVEEVDQSYYTEAGMLTFCEDSVIEYNQSQGAEAVAYQYEAEDDAVLPVSIDDFTYGDEAVLILKYASSADYVAYNGRDETAVKGILFATAKNTLALPDIPFISASGDSETDADSIIGKSGLKIVQIEGAADVQVEGKIQYTSENVTVTGSSSAVTSEKGYSYIIFK